MAYAKEVDSTFKGNSFVFIIATSWRPIGQGQSKGSTSIGNTGGSELPHRKALVPKGSAKVGSHLNRETKGPYFKKCEMTLTIKMMNIFKSTVGKNVGTNIFD